MHQTDGTLRIFQPGTPRTAEDTLREVQYQIRLACRGVALRVSERQTETGIKDAYSQFWIERLIDWSRERQNRQDARSVDEIEAELMGFVNSHHDEIYNPFLTLKCELTPWRPHTLAKKCLSRSRRQQGHSS